MGKQNSKTTTPETTLSAKDMKELCDMTHFNEQEIQEWHEGFVKECPTGSLTMDDFKRVYFNFFPGGNATEFCGYVFRTFDKSEDGTLDFKEFLAAMSVTSKGSLADKLAWAFSMYDLDRDGFISHAEMTDILHAVYKMVGHPGKTTKEFLTPAERTAKLFQAMDTNKDGLISKEEFLKTTMADKGIVTMLQGDP